MDRVEVLFSHHGIFHVQIEMSTCQMMVWTLEDPFNYQIFVGEEVFDEQRWQGHSDCFLSRQGKNQTLI